jgi:hypothetical protein
MNQNNIIKDLLPHDEKIIFLHIPKAAGITLYNILDRQYKKQEIYTIDGVRVKESVEHFKKLSIEKRSNFSLLKGHQPFGLHEYMIGSVKYITMLRNPVDRIISFYYYVLSEPKHYLHDTVKAKKLSLDDFVVSGLSNELDNGQVRLIAGCDVDLEYGGCSRELLEIAKYNIQNFFAVVGLQERFDESLILMKKKLGWKKTILYRKSNITRGKPSVRDVSRDVVRSIEKINELDCELYDFVKDNFESMISSQKEDMARELKLHRRMNVLYNKLYDVFYKPIISLKRVVTSRIISIC